MASSIGNKLDMIQLLASNIPPLLVILAILVDHGACDSINRTSFPPGFLFGASSSAYQYEGAVKEGGRGLSIWDTFTHVYPDKIADRGNGDVADDFYHRYKDDLKNVKKMGMDAFRFSISWPRILPNGSISGGINKEGVNFYNDLIDEIISNGMQPFVTLFHWDLPQTIQDKYMGFLSSAIVKDYADYTDICFREFGDRVKHWTTFNEPSLFCPKGYASGIWAPGRCSPWEEGKCSTGNSGTEPYLCGHNILLAHSAAVNLYRDKYQGIQKGKIGITLCTRWILPHSSSEADAVAAKRTLDFLYGWFMHPLAHGHYPIIMRKILGNRLPKFTKGQSELVKGSYDFIGINYYTTYFAINNPKNNSLQLSYNSDYMANLTGERQDGTQLPKPFSGSFINIYAPGLRDLVLYTMRNYKNPVMYITENGLNELRSNSIPLKDVLNDENRISYHRDHLLTLRSAIMDGADVRGYFVWSFMDNMEWENGYNTRFGLYYVDYSNNLTRHPKKSSFWFGQILKKQNIHYIA